MTSGTTKGQAGRGAGPVGFRACIGLLFASSLFAQPALNLPNTAIPAGSAVYQADSVTAAQGFVIGSGASVTFNATQTTGTVDLLPGFHASTGSVFHAYIGTSISPVDPVNVAPNPPISGSGVSQSFTFTASSPYGFQDIETFQVIINSAQAFNTNQGAVNGCYLSYYSDSDYVGLANDSNTLFLGGTLGSSGTISNSQCTLDLLHSSWSGSGTNFSITVALQFTPNAQFNGLEGVYLATGERTTTACSGYQLMGTWIVPAPTAPDFTLSAPARISTVAGNIASYSVTVTPVNGFSGTATFSASGLPPGASASFSPTSIAGSGSTLVTIQTAANVASTSNIIVTGTSGQLNPSATTQLTVQNSTIPTPDPLRTGVKSTGSYWGGAGEQIDLLSGNLNFTIPLLQAQGRGASGATLGLAYNSQIWRQLQGSTIPLGQDIGYGVGWILQPGALIPQTNYYIFQDGTGAQYKLDQYNLGTYTSRDGTYISYVSNTQQLYFPDGRFWKMNVISASGEPDAGKLYPSLIEDSNGNYITLQYDVGAGSSVVNTSGRITRITDPLATGGNPTYSFSYAQLNPSDPVKHLTGITNNLSSSDNYSFTYSSDVPLQSPFDSTSFGTATLLHTVHAVTQNVDTTLKYSGQNNGELTQMTTALGATLSWGYRTWTYSTTGLAYREVLTRQMTPAAGGTPNTWNITLDSNPSLHASATVSDLGAGTSKAWTFQTAGAFLGLSASYEERTASGTALQHVDYTWAQDTAGNPYMGTVSKNLDLGTSYAVQSKTVQTLDIYGNVTQSQVYDYSNPSTPARTYNYQYVNSAGYLNAYIRNRLLSATITASGQSAVTVVSNTYDGTALTDRPGVIMHDSAFSTGNRLRGNVTQSIAPGPTTRNTSYDIAGVPVTVDDGNVAHITSVQPANTIIDMVPGSVTPYNQSNFQTTMSYNSAMQTTNVTAPNSDTTVYTYDSIGRVATATSHFWAKSTYSYNPGAQQTVVTTVSSSSVVLTPRWQRTTTDGFGRTIKQESGSGTTAGTGTMSTVDTRYGPCACSPLEKMIAVSQPYAPGDTEVWTTYTYDAGGRTLTTTAPDGTSRTTYSYQGNQVTVTDPAGKWKTFTSDAFGNLISVTEPNPSGGTWSTAYSYDTLMHLTQVTMSRTQGTQTRTFTYDPATQRLSSVQTPEGGTQLFTYNTDGTTHSKTDALGQQTTYTYDTFQRVTEVDRYPANGILDPCQTVHYNYDNVTVYEFGGSLNGIGRLTGVYWNGMTAANQLTSSCSLGFSEEYAYSTAGQVFRKVNTVRNLSYQIPVETDFTYDAEGRLSTLTPPGLNHNAQFFPMYIYDHDALGRESDLYYNFSQPQSLVTGVSYNAAGRLLQLTFGGVTQTRSYNANNQLIHLTATTGGNSIVDLAYTFASANNGRVASTTENGETITYTYDQLNRLIQAVTNDSWGISYSYDGFGNLLQQTGQGGAPSTSVSVSAQTNQVSGYSYDANGNLTQDSNGSYSYDVANRLISTGAVYNPGNQRVWDGTYLYYYGVRGELLGKYSPVWQQNGAAQMVSDLPNIYFNGIALHLTNHGSWVVTDRLGSVRADSTGGRLNYYPYGGEVGTETVEGRSKFGTYIRDAAGLDYADQRYYNSAGRFFTPDPGGMSTADPSDPGSWNRYAYVGGDPVNFRDPQGLFRCLSCDDQDQDQPILGLNSFGPQKQPTQPSKTTSSSSTPSLGGPATASQKKLFANAARAAESKLRKSGSPCAGDFGADALQILDGATYTLGVSFASDASGNTTAVPDPNIYATSNPGSQSVTINMVSSFFNITPTPIQGTNLAVGHDMGTGLSQTNFDAFVLLHELGHLTGVLGDDRGKNQSLGDDFNAKILNDCFGVSGWKPPQ